MKIFISSDHAGFSLKDQIYDKLKKRNYRIINLGPFNDKSVDYPIYAKKLANTVSRNKSSFGILVCGSGTGMAMAANKVKNIRAAVCYNVKNTKLSRLHNNANIITVGSRLISKNSAFKLKKIKHISSLFTFNFINSFINSLIN